MATFAHEDPVLLAHITANVNAHLRLPLWPVQPRYRNGWYFQFFPNSSESNVERCRWRQCRLRRLLVTRTSYAEAQARRSLPSWLRRSPKSSSASLHETWLHGSLPIQPHTDPHLGNADSIRVERCLGTCNRRREVDLYGNHANFSCLATGAGRGARHSYLKQCVALLSFLLS